MSKHEIDAYNQGRAEALAEVAPRLAALRQHAEAMAKGLARARNPCTCVGCESARRALAAYNKWKQEQGSD